MERLGRVWVPILVCSVLLASPSLAAEVVEGRVIDAASGKPIAFANIGVEAAHVGTVSDRSGRFQLELPSMSGLVTVSATNYQTRKIPVEEIIASTDVPLAPIEFVVREHVTVTAPVGGPDAGPDEILGVVVKKRSFSVGFGSGQLGTQIGARIRVAHPTLIKSAHFVVDHTGGENFLYRVNLYDFSDGRIGVNRIPEDVIVAAPQQRGPIDVDLTRFGIVVDADVLLCLEWVADDAGAGNGNVMFRGRRRGSSLYMRMTSHSPFEPMRSLGLGFYMIGSPVP